MVLSTVRIDSVTPRGGPATAAIVVLGTGFGTTPGSVVLDPLGKYGAPTAAAVTLWQNDRIEFTVPTLGFDNRFTTLLIEKDGSSDSANVPFWVPAAGTPALTGLPTGLDYQYPSFEAGDQESDDDPTRASAADFNRTLDKTVTTDASVETTTLDIIDKIATDESGNVIVDEAGNVVVLEC